MVKEKVIDAHHLKKFFHGQPGVKDVSIEVRKGEIFGFLGPNGSGKTTTIRMICGLLTPDAGTGDCLGYNILTQSDEIKRQVGYMPQKFSLYEDLTVAENLEFIALIYGMRDIPQTVMNASKELGLFERKNQLVKGLSGGWKQRLALAAALLHNPLLLLLDEPTAGVDPRARRDFWDQLHRLSTQGITTLVSTHYMDEAQRCNRLAYLSRGLVLVQGTAQQIITQSGLFTWEIKGHHLYRLKEQLEGKIGQIISYGQTLHVSGRDETELAKIAQQFSKDYTWSPIETTLEDVFINLVDSEGINE